MSFNIDSASSTLKKEILINLDGESIDLPLKSESPTISTDQLPDFKWQVASVPNGNNKLIDLITNDISKFLEEFEPLPTSVLDLSENGTRSISGRHPLLPGRIITLSGLFLVKANNLQDEHMTLTIEKPDLTANTYEMLHIGNRFVDKDGNVWNEHNHEPFGAYSKRALENKVILTHQYGNDYGVVIEGYGYHVDVTDVELGWLIYSTPDDVFTPTELFWIDLNLPNHRGQLYGKVIYNLTQDLRELHLRKRKSHGQVHPGNWIGTIEDTEPTIILKDWSTVQDLEDLPLAPDQTEIQNRGLTLDKYAMKVFSKLTPEEKLRALDLSTALEDSIGMRTAGLETRGSSTFFRRYLDEIGAKELPITDEEFTIYELKLLCFAIAGYLDIPYTSSNFAKAQEYLLNAYISSARRTIELSGVHNTRDIINDLKSIFATEAIEYMGNYGIQSIRDNFIRQMISLMIKDPQKVKEEIFIS